MKKILFITLFSFVFYCLAVGQEDTVVVIYDETNPEAPYEIQLNDKSIIFTEQSNDNEYIYDAFFDSKYRGKFKGYWQGMELGFNGYVDNDFGYTLNGAHKFLDLYNTKSLNFNLNVFDYGVNLVKNRFGIVFGAGLQWNNYKFHKNVVISADSSFLYGYRDTTVSAQRSKLNILWVRVPIFLEYQTPRGFYVSAGPVIGVRLGAHTKRVYHVENSKKIEKGYDDFYLSPFKLDGEFRIGYKSIGVFASYSFTELFKSGKGAPALHSYAVGISCNF